MARMTIVKDIAQWQRAEGLFRTLAYSSPVGIYILQGGRFCFVNSQFQRDTDYSEEELLSTAPPTLVHPEDRDLVRENAIQMLKGERSSPYEYRAIRKSGEVIWILETVASIEHNGRRATLGNFMDITQRIRVREALRDSEERYRTLFEQSRDAIYITSRDGRVVDMNQSALDLSGYTREEMIGMDVRKTYVDPAARPIFLRDIEQKGWLKDYELKLRKKDGTVIDCLVTSWVKLDKDGSILGYQGILRDITEYKRAQAALRNSERHFRSLIENASDAIVVLNSNANIRYASPAAERVLGHKPEELLGRDLHEFFHPDDIANTLSQFEQVLKQPDIILQTEVRFQHPCGSWRIIEAVFRNLLDDLAVVGIVVNCRDITERKQAEEALRLLSRREWQVLQLTAQGQSSTEVASRLCISRRTVEAHRANLMRKLGLHSRADLIRYSFRKGILPAED